MIHGGERFLLGDVYRLFRRYGGKVQPPSPFRLWTVARIGDPPVAESRTALSSPPVQSGTLMMLIALALVQTCCAPVPQPDSIRTVAAIEIPLATARDRRDLLALLRQQAAAHGLHVDDLSAQQRRNMEELPLPAALRGTLFVGVWRGANDDEMEAGADDMGHPGRAWLNFARGTDPVRSTRVREAFLAALRRRWPGARPIPVTPAGGLPLAEDLRWMAQGYRIDRARAASYELPQDSPLLMPR
jgi:hypothetical protein